MILDVIRPYFNLDSGLSLCLPLLAKIQGSGRISHGENKGSLKDMTREREGFRPARVEADGGAAAAGVPGDASSSQVVLIMLVKPPSHGNYHDARLISSC